MADQSDETRLTPRDRKKTWECATGNDNVFQLERFHHYVLEMEDVHFHFDSAVLLPDHGDCGKTPADTPAPQRITGLAVLRACFLHAKAHPDQQLLLAGHADTSGKPAYNLTLSEKRAQIVHAVLLGGKTTWVEIVSHQHTVKDYQQILTWVDAEWGWGCDPDGIDGDRGVKTIAAIKSFQHSYNREFDKQIDVDGKVGEETWGAIFDLYLAGLRRRLGVADDASLSGWQSELRWLDAAQPFVGCGENYPIEAPERHNYRSETNRRVELLFFTAENAPRLDCHPSPGACEPTVCEIYNPRFYTREYIPCEPEAATRFALRVIDEQGTPLAGEPYVIRQNGLSQEGVLDADGLAYFVHRTDPEQPFRIEIVGRVCAIEEGAVLLIDEPDTEYGGSFFDWTRAENDAAFWDVYKKHDKSPARSRSDAGPATFWQHEYITRRTVRIRREYLDNRATLRATVRAIPVQIRTGPMLRYTSDDKAVVWMELETPALVRVKVRPAGGAASGPSEVLYHSVTVHAGGRYFAAVPLYRLDENSRYQYTVELSPMPATGPIPKQGGFTPDVFPYDMPKPVLANIKAQLARCSYDGSEWISFSTLRRTYDDHLRFAYGSCRKPHGRGADALEGFGKTLASTKRSDWPSFIVHIGDQIYADDLSKDQAGAIHTGRFAWAIPGPLAGDRLQKGAWGGRFGTRVQAFQEAYTGQSSEFAEPPKYSVDNMLWEIPVTFTAAHAKELKAAGDGAPAVHAADFAEYAFLYERAWAESIAVRQLLAHVPSFMIFDDHEITDDWNFDDDWVRLVHETSDFDHWPDTMTDGLAAYWLYQGWCNLDPSEWNGHPLTKILLAAAEQGIDALPRLRAAIAPTVRPPKSASESRAITWHYKLPIEPAFLVLDLRTQRVIGKSAKSSQMITDAQLRWMQQELVDADRAGRSGAFVVASVPALMPPAAAFGQSLLIRDEPGLQDEIARLLVSHEKRRERDFEHWMADGSWEKLRGMIESLSKNRSALKSVVMLSGDVHFSYNMRARLSGENAPVFPELLQLVSSSLKNEQGGVGKYKLRELTEPRSSAVTEPEREDTTLMTVLRWLANPWRPDAEFLGMEIFLGGMRGIKNLTQTLLVDSSIALVDAWFTHPGEPNYRPGELVLRELHLVGGQGTLDSAQPRPPKVPYKFGPPVPGKEPVGTGPGEFWYQTAGDGGSVMTLAPFIGDGR